MPTKSRPAALLGVQVPRVRHAPSVRANAWEDVVDLAKAYGLVLDEWQENVLEAAMGERSDGRWAAPTVGISVPRQNGKGALIEARELAGLLIFGEKLIVHSAHEQATARMGFQRILSYFENYDDLRKKVRSVMSAINREHIRLKNGAELHFPARSKGRIRGYSIDCLILDEAQVLGDPAWEAIKPTISARPNVQTWLLGTPPTPLDDGAVFTRNRQRGLEGKDHRLCWCEWSAAPGTSLDDRSGWIQANPALGIRVRQEAVEDERIELSEKGFARERLGMWDEIDSHEPIVDLDRWADLADDGPALDVKPDGMAVDASHDRDFSVAACWVEEEFAHAEEVWASGDEAGTLRWVATKAGRRIPVVIDSMSPAASLIPGLKALGVDVKSGSSGDMSKACGMWLGEVAVDRLTHGNQGSVNSAVMAATQRDIGTAGGWGWDRRDHTNIAPLVAHTLARYAASLKRKPSGRGRVSTGSRKAVVM